MPMPSGGLLIFNDCCFHGADRNHSTASRRSMTLAFPVHDVGLDDPEKILVCGKMTYIWHPLREECVGYWEYG